MNIKPCPFCGKPALLRGSENVGDHGPFYYVECANIKCMANCAGKDTPEEAIAVWNRRAYESTEPTADA